MTDAYPTICPFCRTENRSDARYCQKCGSNIMLNNIYRIVRLIKEGGQGSVYEALDRSGRRYALKELIDRFHDPRERQEAIERFHAEAKILRGLQHERIPKVHHDFDQGGRYFVAMDFVDGEDLEELLKRHQRFDEAQMLTWAEQITAVLDYLHSRGVIYRDMKPSNIMVERNSGNVKLVDFGIAKIFQPTQRGTLIGTPGYAPPEQYQGLATPQSDIYALGATLHHVLTGRDPRDEPPFSFPPVHDLVPSASSETAAAIERALEMEPRLRWPSIRAFRMALPLDRQSQRLPQPTTMLKSPPASSRQQVPSPLPAPRPTVPKAIPVPEPALSAPRVGQHPVPQAGRFPQPAAPAPTRPKAPPVAPPVPRPRRRVNFGGLIVALLLVTVLVYIVEPGVRNGVNSFVLQFVERTPTAQPYVSRPVEFELEVRVSSTLQGQELQAQLREAFLAAFALKAKETYGEAAQVNMNAPPGYQGTPLLVQQEGVEDIYQVVMSGSVSAPLQ